MVAVDRVQADSGLVVAPLSGMYQSPLLQTPDVAMVMMGPTGTGAASAAVTGLTLGLGADVKCCFYVATSLLAANIYPTPFTLM